jgi:threonine/homoserine/homoserine lactone efflux protein
MTTFLLASLLLGLSPGPGVLYIVTQSAAYLVFLGGRMIFTRPQASVPDAAPALPRSTFVDGMLVALLNPKTLVFFSAFLPQFMNMAEPSLPQGSLLVVMFVLVTVVTDSGYAVAAGWVARPLQQSRQAQTTAQLIGGGLLVGLGILVLLR